MESIRHIEKDGIRYASFFKKIEASGPRFLSRTEDEMQFGVLVRPEGHQIPAHAHPKNPHTVELLSEFLYIEEGKVEVTVYDESWAELGKETLEKGDFLTFLRGGHSLTMLEPARMLEVKQGPYPGDAKAKVFRDEGVKGY